MNFSIRDLEACLAVAELRNFSRAAERCHVSQSAFSMRISAIEETLGSRLFDRTTRSVEVTKEGAIFIDSARRLLTDFTDLVGNFQDHAHKRRGRIEIAALPSLAAAWLPAVFATFHENYPGITLVLHDIISEACLARVRDGTVDFALASSPPDGEDMESHLLSEEKFYLVCARDHALTRKGALKPRDLAEHPYISVMRETSVRQSVERAMHPFKLQTFMELEHMATVAGMVQAGLGFAVMPELTLFQFNRPGLVVKPLKIPNLTRSIYVVRRKGKTLSAAASELYDFIMAERSKIHHYLRLQLDDKVS